MIAWLIIRKRGALAIKAAVSVPGITGVDAAGLEAAKTAALLREGFYTVPIGKMPSAPGKTPMPSTRLSTLQWAFEAMSIWSAIILVKMGKSVYGYKGCAQPHPRDQPLFGRPPVRLLYEMENYSANRHKDIYFIDMLPFGKAGEMRLILPCRSVIWDCWKSRTIFERYTGGGSDCLIFTSPRPG